MLHGISTDDVKDCTFSAAHERSEADLQICDTLLDVLGQLLHAPDPTLHSEVMNESNLMWEKDPQFGPLAARFRDSQRRLVGANVKAVTAFREHVAKATAETLGGGRRGGGNQRNNKRRRR